MREFVEDDTVSKVLHGPPVHRNDDVTWRNSAALEHRPCAKLEHGCLRLVLRVIVDKHETEAIALVEGELN